MLQNVPLFALLSLRERLALGRAAIVKACPRNSAILREGERTGSPYAINSGKVRVLIENRLSKQEIASMIGASREMVPRILKRLAHHGHLTTEGRRIVLSETPPSGDRLAGH